MNAALHGKALVTGASSGIGAIYADRLARRGLDLVLVARNAARMADLAYRLESDFGVRVEVLAADLTDPGQLAAVEKRLAEDSSITVLINNAGVAMDGALLTASPGEVETLVALNVLAPTSLARAAGRRFAAEGHGAIINICSVMALMPEVGEPTYSGTKAFLLNLSLGLAHQLEGSGVRVQAVLPGATRTEIWERSGRDPDALFAGGVMSAADLVDAAIVGFDKGETVTIPPLPDVAMWDELNRNRLAMAPHLNERSPASRYLTAAA